RDGGLRPRGAPHGRPGPAWRQDPLRRAAGAAVPALARRTASRAALSLPLRAAERPLLPGAVRLCLPRGRWTSSPSGPPLPWGGSPFPSAEPVNTPCRTGPFGSAVTAAGGPGVAGTPGPTPARRGRPAGRGTARGAAR